MYPATKLSALLLLIVACSEDKTTHLLTAEATEIRSKSAKCGGAISTSGVDKVESRGICWSTNPTPDISINKTVDGYGSGAFSSLLTGLIPNTRYYVRAYATNGSETAYGQEVNFSTKETLTLTAGDSTSSGVLHGKFTERLGCGGNCYLSSSLSVDESNFLFALHTTVSISGGSYKLSVKVLSMNTFVSIGPDIDRLRAHDYGDLIDDNLQWGAVDQEYIMKYYYQPFSGTPPPYVAQPWDGPGSKYMAFKFEENGNTSFGWLKIGPTGGYYYFRSYGYVSN